MCTMSTTSCDDKRRLVDQSASLDESQEDSASSNKKFRFFSIGFNSKPDESINRTDTGRSTSVGNSPEQESQLHNPKPVSSTNQRRSIWRDKSRNKEHKTTINDQLASFDTEESYEDDVFSKGIIDLDDTDDGDLGMGDLLQNKPLFPRGDSLETPSPDKTSNNMDDVDADADLSGLSDVHDRIESKSKFTDIYYCTGSTEDLLKEVTGEEQADKQTRKLVSQYRKLIHNPSDRVGDAGDDDSLASGSSSSKEPEDHTPLISDEEDIARDDDEMPFFGKKPKVAPSQEEASPPPPAPVEEVPVEDAPEEKASEEKAPEPEKEAELEQKVEEQEQVSEPAPEVVKAEEPAKTEDEPPAAAAEVEAAAAEPAAEPANTETAPEESKTETTDETDSSKPEENDTVAYTKDLNEVDTEEGKIALPGMTTDKSEKSPLITKNGCESGTEVNGSGVKGDSKFKDAAPGMLCCTIM